MNRKTCGESYSVVEAVGGSKHLYGPLSSSVVGTAGVLCRGGH